MKERGNEQQRTGRKRKSSEKRDSSIPTLLVLLYAFCDLEFYFNSKMWGGGKYRPVYDRFDGKWY